MTSPAPATPLQVIQQLGHLASEMDRLTKALREAEYAAAHASADANVAEARAFLYSTGPVEQRKATAKVEVADKALASELADVEVRCLRRELDAVRTRIEVGRTYAATVRTELTSLGNAA